MVLPRFPPIYHESQMPDVNTISEVVVIVCDAWKVGNMVDWWADGCYWSARVTELLGDEKLLPSGSISVPMDLDPLFDLNAEFCLLRIFYFMVKYEMIALGEGSSYEASSKDLRPSLFIRLDTRKWLDSAKFLWEMEVVFPVLGSLSPSIKVRSLQLGTSLNSI
ncbi:hypothetical protein CJ030_MR3G020090 [Morella rubra]|uniref:Agenet domain-containing protein n=1 Tax=Morella rubra TaxID=262757 RepID=A0A6A1W4Y8_9ROSI|nr:hypothetical protein CJ030_MR3G020090 [Morella rubra]